MWLTNGKETLDLNNDVQIAAFKNSGYKECKAPKKRADKAPKKRADKAPEEPVKDGTEA